MVVRRPPEHVINSPDLEREPCSIMKKDTHSSCGLLKTQTVTNSFIRFFNTPAACGGVALGYNAFYFKEEKCFSNLLYFSFA